MSEELESSSPSPAGAPEVALGSPLPNAELAHIDSAKLRLYALDRSNPVGKHKAAVFSAALGIEQNDWHHLKESILEELPHRPVSGVRPPKRPEERYTWEVLVPVQGLRDQQHRRLLVITAWEMVDNRPQLVTLRVAPKARQRAV